MATNAKETVHSTNCAKILAETGFQIANCNCGAELRAKDMNREEVDLLVDIAMADPWKRRAFIPILRCIAENV